MNMYMQQETKQWLIQGGVLGACVSLFGFLFFYKSEVYEQKISIKRIRNLSQNSGNGHFGDSNFQNFLESMSPDSLKSLCCRRS